MATILKFSFHHYLLVKIPKLFKIKAKQLAAAYYTSISTATPCIIEVARVIVATQRVKNYKYN